MPEEPYLTLPAFALKTNNTCTYQQQVGNERATTLSDLVTIQTAKPSTSTFPLISTDVIEVCYCILDDSAEVLHALPK